MLLVQRSVTKSLCCFCVLFHATATGSGQQQERQKIRLPLPERGGVSVYELAYGLSKGSSEDKG